MELGSPSLAISSLKKRPLITLREYYTPGKLISSVELGTLLGTSDPSLGGTIPPVYGRGHRNFVRAKPPNWKGGTDTLQSQECLVAPHPETQLAPSPLLATFL